MQILRGFSTNIYLQTRQVREFSTLQLIGIWLPGLAIAMLTQHVWCLYAPELQRHICDLLL